MVKYLDRAQNYTQRVVQHQNLANISARGGQIEAEEYDFLGVSNPTAANIIAARVLKTVSSPLSKVNFSANRSATVLRPGSVFKLEWPKLGIASVIYRVTELDLGTLESPTIRVTAVEDIFSIPSVAYTAPQPSGWVRPTDEPLPLAAQKLVEAPRALYGDSRVVITGEADVAQPVVMKGPGWRYLTVQIRDCRREHAGVLARGGTANVIGMIPVGVNIELHGADFLAEKRIQGSLMGSNRFPVDMPRFVDFYMTGKLKLDQMISRRIKLDQVNDMMRGKLIETEDYIRFTKVPVASPNGDVFLKEVSF
jgi:hypothetical protein